MKELLVYMFCGFGALVGLLMLILGIVLALELGDDIANKIREKWLK